MAETVADVLRLTPDEAKAMGPLADEPYCWECNWLARLGALAAGGTCFACGRGTAEVERQEARLAMVLEGR